MELLAALLFLFFAARPRAFSAAPTRVGPLRVAPAEPSSEIIDVGGAPEPEAVVIDVVDTAEAEAAVVDEEAAVIDVPPVDPPIGDSREESGAGRGGARWRVVAAWARWERSGLIAHLDDPDLLRDAVASAAPATETILANEAFALEARLEVAEALLQIGADAETCVAAFEAFAESIDTPLSTAISRLRKRLAAPVAVAAEDVDLKTAALATRERATDAWLAIDAYASDVRRQAAMEATDARALLAELATTVVALRRLEPARRKAVALQAVHVHLPLGELLRNLRPGPRFDDAPLRALLEEVEDRSYSTLFPETYAHVRAAALKARRAVGPSPELFAAEARCKIAARVAACPNATRAFFPSRASALVASATALALPLEVELERRLLVEARVKSPASALRKMLSSGNTKAVRDNLGLRVVVLGETPEEDASHASLYAVRDALECLGGEVDGRFKDYVANPKSSGYRSLHCTLLRREDGVLCEVQIRSRDMHWQATFGSAAHARYAMERRDPAIAEFAPKALPAPSSAEE